MPGFGDDEALAEREAGEEEEDGFVRLMMRMEAPRILWTALWEV